MSQHTGNNHDEMNWKDQFDQADYFSTGEKDQAWSKLEGRFERRRKRRAGWYWLAACCILVLAGGLCIRTMVHEQGAAIQTPIASVSKNAPTVAAANMPGATDPVVSHYPEANSISPKLIVVTKPASKVPVTIKVSVPIVDCADNLKAEAVILNGIIPASAVNTMLDSPTKKLVVVQSVKQRLPVVHINEVDEPMPNTFKRPTATDYSIIQFRLTPQATTEINSPTKIGLSFSTGKSNPAN